MWLVFFAEKIRVGKDFQTVCPDFIPLQDRKLESLNDRALLVWSPTKDIPDNKLEEYINVAKERFGYNGEQALGMLFWHKHDLERAVLDLANFTPFPDEWTEEDKVLFEQAFQFHGKSFHRIRQMVINIFFYFNLRWTLELIRNKLWTIAVAGQINCEFSEILLFMEENT